MPADVEVDDRHGGAHTGAEPPEAGPARFDLVRREHQPDADASDQDNQHRQHVALAAQEHPGEDRDEQRVGHVEDVGMGHGGCLDRHIEAVDRNAVRDRPTCQQMIFYGAWRTLLYNENACDDQKSE